MRSPRIAMSIPSVIASAFALVALAATALAVPAGAAVRPETLQPTSVIEVTNTTDCDTSGCGSLRAAIDAANLEVTDPTITFDLPPSSTILLTSDLPTITRSMSIVGPGPRDLTIHGAGSYRAFTADGEPGESLSISGMEIIHNFNLSSGGAIESSGFDLTLRDVYAEFNMAGNPSVTSIDGGGVFAAGGGAIHIIGCVFNANIAFPVTGDDSHGGSLFLSAFDITIDDTVVSDSLASYDGGLVLDAEYITITRSTIRGNQATIANGGGTIGATTIDISESRFSSNLAEYGISGVLLNAYTRVSVTDSRFDHNGDADGAPASAFGVGYFVSNDLQLDRVTIDHNRGDQIAGPVILGGGSVTNSTISDNDGIGILVGGLGVAELSPQTPADPARVTISHTTVTDNTADGISASNNSCVTGSNSVASVLLSACSFGAQGSNSPSVSIPTGLLTLDHVVATGNGLVDVLAPGTASYSLIGTSSTDLVATTGMATGDPLLSPLVCVDDLHCVRTFPTTSPAWNAGDPAFTGPPLLDEIGQPRIVDVVDLGAWENQTAILRPAFTG